MSKVKVAAPSKKDLRQLADGVHRNPHSILGAHPDGKGTIIRALRPYAESVAARIGGVDYPLHHVDAGVFSAKAGGAKPLPAVVRVVGGGVLAMVLRALWYP